MFRKTWKQIKIFIAIAVIIICIPRSILPIASKTDDHTDDLTYYLKVNESETRLSEFRDDSTALRIKLDQLEIINKSRKRYGAKPVKLDIMASRLANKMSLEAAENVYTGHWNLAGEKPYHRYAFAGGYDHITENAYGEWSSAYGPDMGLHEIAALMKAGHEVFMKEKAPNDGHKQTIISKEHNYVGIGYHLAGNQFRYYEEFVDRYFEFENIPSSAKPGENTTITVRTDENSYLYFMIVYYEGFPNPLTPKEISKRASYPDYTDQQYQQVYAWDLAKYRKGSEYRIPLSFSNKGLYYIHLFSDVKEYTSPTRLSTKGKTPYSGIVISVKE